MLDEHPVIRTLAVLTAAIGLLLGVGTTVGWIVSDSFTEAAFTALRVAGLVWFIGGGVFWLILSLRESGPIWWRALWGGTVASRLF